MIFGIDMVVIVCTLDKAVVVSSTGLGIIPSTAERSG